MSPDTALFLTINGFARSTPGLAPIVLAYANYGIVAFGALILAGWWVARRSGDPSRMAAAIWVPIATLIAVGLNQPIAAVVMRARPYTAMPDILVLAGRSVDPSFPSDHAVMAGAVASGLFLVNRRLGIVAVVAAAVMAFARVYIAAHYPLDVLAGLVLGTAVSLFGFLLVRKVLVRVVVAADCAKRRALRTP
jgi:undecaprenyl-diphosphatase